MSIPGGFTETTAATEETQKICDEVKPQVEEKTHKKYEEFRAVEYREQIVAGSIFFIKVCVGGNDYLHVKVFQKLPCHGGKLMVLGVQEGHTKDDPIYNI